MLICPKCKEALFLKGKSFICKNNHCYDLARQGYANLSLKQKASGDNKEMVKARTEFLEKNYYDFMRQKVKEILQQIHPEVLVDIGCGEGYYTKVFSQTAISTYGIDLSKEAILHASRMDKNTQYFVSSIFELPFSNDSVDAITSLFTPIPLKEVLRVLKPGGSFIVVGPGPDHLYELKEAIYPSVRKNELPLVKLEGLKLENSQTIKEKVKVEDLVDLFDMTPYKYKSPIGTREKLAEMEPIEITFEFFISTFRKED